MPRKQDPLHAILDAIEDVKTLRQLEVLLEALRERNTIALAISAEIVSEPFELTDGEIDKVCRGILG